MYDYVYIIYIMYGISVLFPCYFHIHPWSRSGPGKPSTAHCDISRPVPPDKHRPSQSVTWL